MQKIRVSVSLDHPVVSEADSAALLTDVNSFCGFVHNDVTSLSL